MAASHSTSDNSYIVPHPRCGRVNLQGALHCFGLDDDELAVKFANKKFTYAFTERTVMSFVHLLEVQTYMHWEFRDAAAGLNSARQCDLPNVWEVKVTAPDGTVGVFDSKFDTDRPESEQRTLNDYPRLFVENCRVDVYTPLYRWRLHALTRMGFADMHEYMEFVGPAA